MSKWHLIERCNETLANALGALVTSNSDGRIDALQAAEAVAVDEDKDLPEPFKNDPFTREWLQLHPPLGETDLRPLLHLSRDTATRDFGADNMSTEGRALRDALVSATNANAPLTQAITAAGAIQAEMAMVRAWQLKASKRSWRAGEDVVPLIEPCKVFPQLGSKAASLLGEAPVADIGPGIIPQLFAQNWARPVLDQWETGTAVNKTTKAAIQRAKKGTQ